MNTNTIPRDTNGNPLIEGNHYNIIFRGRNKVLLKQPRDDTNGRSQHPSEKFNVQTEDKINVFEDILFELYNMEFEVGTEERWWLDFQGRDSNREVITMEDWKPEWASYRPVQTILTPERHHKRDRPATPVTVKKKTRLTYGGKRRRKKTRKKKRRRKTRRKKTRKKKRRRKTRRKKTRKKKKRRKKTRKKRGGNGDDMPGIEMKQFNKKYPQNQPPQNQPRPLHQRLNKKGEKTWKTLKGFFGLTPSKEVQAKHWEKQDKQVASSILDKQFE